MQKSSQIIPEHLLNFKLMIIALITIALGFVFLIWSADKLVENASTLAIHSKISPIMVGLTIIALGTSAPEIFVSAMAAYSNNNDIAIGNVVGSNIMNIALVLGVTAVLKPIKIESHILKQELPVLLLVTVLAGILLFDNQLVMIEGLILIAALIAFLCWLYFVKRDSSDEKLAGEVPEISNIKAGIWVVICLIILPLSARLLVFGAVKMAQILGLSELIIGLTIIAIGTSLPELATVVASIIRRQHGLALGNIIGSNIFNLIAVLPFPALINPGLFDEKVISRDYPIMMFVTVLMIATAYRAIVSRKANSTIGKVEGVLYLSSFVGYTYILFLTN